MSKVLYNGRILDLVTVPRIIANCPECGGTLTMEVCEWESDSGKPTDGGIHLDCENEPAIDAKDREGEHRFWQSDWMPVVDRVLNWARRYVRVMPAAAIGGEGEGR